MDVRDLRKLSEAELKEKLNQTRKELFNMRFQHATKQLENTAGLAGTRADVARILTLLKEKERGA